MQSDMQLIRERKPHLSPHSYTTYRQSLKRLYKVSPTLDLAAVTVSRTSPSRATSSPRC